MLGLYACAHVDKDVCVSGVPGVNYNVIQQQPKTRKHADADTLAIYMKYITIVFITVCYSSVGPVCFREPHKIQLTKPTRICHFIKSTYHIFLQYFAGHQ